MTYSTKGVESEIMSRREGQNKNIHVTGRTFLHMSYVWMQTRAGIGGNLCVRLFFGMMGAWWWVGGFQDRWAACLPHTSLIPPFANKANCLGHHPCLCIERAREAAIWCQPSADAWYLAGGGPRSCDRGRMFGQELGRDWFCLSNKCKPESPEGLMRSPSFRHCRQWKKGGGQIGGLVSCLYFSDLAVSRTTSIRKTIITFCFTLVCLEICSPINK